MTYKNWTRFDVMMPPELAHIMEDLEQRTGLSRCEIFRRAMVLYNRVKENQQEQGNVLLRSSVGEIIELVGF